MSYITATIERETGKMSALLGVYDKDEAIKRLKVDKLYDQVLFHTEKSLKYCRFIGYEDLEGAK
jgi:hypothetical protein